MTSKTETFTHQKLADNLLSITQKKEEKKEHNVIFTQKCTRKTVLLHFDAPVLCVNVLDVSKESVYTFSSYVHLVYITVDYNLMAIDGVLLPNW